MSDTKEKIDGAFSKVKTFLASTTIWAGLIQIVASALSILYGVDLMGFVTDSIDIIQNTELTGYGITGLITGLLTIYGRLKARTIVELPKLK